MALLPVVADHLSHIYLCFLLKAGAKVRHFFGIRKRFAKVLYDLWVHLHVHQKPHADLADYAEHC